jgi:hypothetical protein
MPDHVHLLEQPTFGWQDGFACFSVSQSNADAVRRYIENQGEHHRSRSFKEELIEFLERHGVTYDPRYVVEPADRGEGG